MGNFISKRLNVYVLRCTTGYFHGVPKKYSWRERFPIQEIGRIDGGRGFRTKKDVFRIGGNAFYDRKNKIPMKIPKFKRSRIGLIAEFCRIPNGFPNLALLLLSPSPQQCGSCTKISAQRKWKGKRRKRTGKTVRCDVGSGEKLIKEESKDAARPHSGIRLSVINEVNEDSTDEEDNDKKTIPTIKLQTTMRKPAFKVVVSPCPPLIIARVTLFLE